MQQLVSVQKAGEIAVVTIDAPPRNTLTSAVRKQLAEVVENIGRLDGVRAVVLAGKGTGFASGPDPDNVADSVTRPTLSDLNSLIEACPLPIIAAIHGNVFGPPLELALAAHYRLADKRAILGFPDIRVGLPPCGGATQRLPRVLGIDHALDLFLSGRVLSAEDGHGMGLVDAVAQGPLPRFAITWVKSALEAGLAPRPASEKPTPTPADADIKAIRGIRSARGNEGNPAVARLLDCVEASLTVDFAQAIGMERAAFDDCLNSTYSQCMRHSIRAEARAARPPITSPSAPKQLSRIGVIGVGRIGRGVVASCLAAGYPVTLVEQDIDRAEEAVEAVIDLFDREISQKQLSTDERDRRIAQLTATVDVTSLATADFVIEATTEDAGTKRRVFAALDAVMKRDAILATATSGLDLDGLAAGTGRAHHVIGLHFFPPAYQMRAVEVVLGLETTDEAIATAFDFVDRLNKIPLATAVSDGFMAHRMAASLVDAALVLITQGHSIETIDAALERYGFAIGPLKLADAIGIDTLQALQRTPTSQPGQRIRSLMSRLVDAGRMGRRTGHGFYRYSASGRAKPVPDTKIGKLIEGDPPEASRLSRDDIARRCIAALANQGAHLVHDNVAQRPSDLDVLMVQVFGYPRHKGGPMLEADLSGMLDVIRELEALSPEAPELWAPAPLWKDLMDSGLTLASLNA